MNNRRAILLRFDDICPTMNWAQWEKAKQLMDKAGVTALLGVIPDCQDPNLLIDEPRPDFWDYLKELQRQGYVIAMHGLHHVFELKSDGLVTRDKISEFAGLPYDVQLEKIKEGKSILLGHGIESDVFFAPAHSYDDNTLKALAACGFHYISDGLSCKPYKRNEIICIPARSKGIPKIKSKGRYTAVLHAHEWVQMDKAGAFEQLNIICREYKDNIKTFSDFIQEPLGNPIHMRLNELLYFQKVNLAPRLRRIIRVVNK